MFFWLPYLTYFKINENSVWLLFILMNRMFLPVLKVNQAVQQKYFQFDRIYLNSFTRYASKIILKLINEN